jgi:methylglutaconyl-CoA hydratase
MRTLTLDRDSRGVARVALARTGVLNAFDETMIAELSETFAALATKAEVRAIVLTAEGRAFCAGADIAWMQRQSSNGFEANRSDSQRFAEMLRLIDECPKPTVTRVTGDAFGGGVGLIAASDIAVSVNTARFAISEARFGILPAVIGPYLVRSVGMRQAQRLAMTTNLFSADEALRFGLIHEVAAPDQLDAAVERTVSGLLRSSPTALTEIKRLYRRLASVPIDSRLRELTAEINARVRATDDAREGFAAFLGKRAPAWVKQ